MLSREVLTRSLIVVGLTIAGVAMAETAGPARVTIAAPVASNQPPAAIRQLPQPAMKTFTPLTAQQLASAKQAVATSLKSTSGGAPSNANAVKLTGPIVLDPQHLSASAGGITATMRGMLISMPAVPNTWWVNTDPQEEGRVVLELANVAGGQMLLLDCTLDGAESPNVDIKIVDGAAKTVHDQPAKVEANHLLYGFVSPPAGLSSVTLVPKHLPSTPGYHSTFFNGCTLHPVL